MTLLGINLPELIRLCKNDKKEKMIYNMISAHKLHVYDLLGDE